MFNYGKRSIAVLTTVHPDLQKVFLEAIKIIDISCYEGIRTTETQQKYYKDGKSKLDGIIKKSKHQGIKGVSFAIDVAPYPIDFDSDLKKKARFYYMAGIIIAISNDLYNKGVITHKVRWGGDWDYDNNFNDQSFDDLPHFELY